MPHIWYALCGLYSMYYLCVKCSRLENACFVALSNTRMLFQMRNHNIYTIYTRTHWWTELRLLWMWFHFGANSCFISMWFEIPWPFDWTAQDHHNGLELCFWKCFSTKYIFFRIVYLLLLVQCLFVCIQWSFCDVWFS